MNDWLDIEIPAHSKKMRERGVVPFDGQQDIDPNKISAQADKPPTEDTIKQAIALSIRNRMFDDNRKAVVIPDKPPSQMT